MKNKTYLRLYKRDLRRTIWHALNEKGIQNKFLIEGHWRMTNKELKKNIKKLDKTIDKNKRKLEYAEKNGLPGVYSFTYKPHELYN